MQGKNTTAALTTHSWPVRRDFPQQATRTNTHAHSSRNPTTPQGGGWRKDPHWRNCDWAGVLVARRASLPPPPPIHHLWAPNGRQHESFSICEARASKTLYAQRRHSRIHDVYTIHLTSARKETKCNSSTETLIRFSYKGDRPLTPRREGGCVRHLSQVR